MLTKTEGIVLKSIKYSETSIICKIFTREYGVHSFIIPGVRGSKNKTKGNLFQPLQILELDIYYHPEKSLLKIKEYRPALIYRHLYSDIVKQSVALFAIEILAKCIQEHEINAPIYDYNRNYLIRTDEITKIEPTTPQHFLLQMCSLMGIKPDSQCLIEEKPYFNIEMGIFEASISPVHKILEKQDSLVLYRFLIAHHESFSKKERQTLLRILLNYLQFHIPNFKQVHSLAIIQQIFA